MPTMDNDYPSVTILLMFWNDIAAFYFKLFQFFI